MESSAMTSQYTYRQPAECWPDWESFCQMRTTTRTFLDAPIAKASRRLFLSVATGPIASVELEELIARKSDYYLELVSGGPPFVSGAIEFIREASRSYSLAIASGALRREIDFVLRAGGLCDFFRVVISADDTSHSKPHPEVYQKALEQMDVDLLPANCVAIEDSVRGVASAKSAGMKCLALTTSLGHDALSSADWVLPGFPSLASAPWSRSPSPSIP